MNHDAPVRMTSDSLLEYFEHRGILSQLQDFEPRSIASARQRLDPDVGMATLLEVFRGYDILWRQGSAAEVHQELFLRRTAQALQVSLSPGHLFVAILSEKDDAPQVLERLMAKFRPFAFKNEEPDGIWVSFAHLGQRGVEETTQFLHCPSWEEIQGNYPPATHRSLETLLALKEPWKHGRIVIWHGPPGTGKTFAIRALMKAWKDRFSYLVVNDPENLAGMPGYYYQVASDSAERPRRFRKRIRVVPPDEEDDDSGASAEPLHRLFILEDSADLILQESRSLHFDKVGKLLNMTDGLFGQGREDLFLITFNEAVTRIDPAFLRPGRCVARVEFSSFPASDASEWLRARGREEPGLKEPATLAELYGRLHREGSQPIPPAQEILPAVGFTRRR